MAFCFCRAVISFSVVFINNSLLNITSSNFQYHNMALKSVNGNKNGGRQRKPKALKSKAGKSGKKAAKPKHAPKSPSASPVAKVKATKKRVSFAQNLERSKLIDEITGE